jgi:hypothetical protein
MVFDRLLYLRRDGGGGRILDKGFLDDDIFSLFSSG